MGGMLLRWPLLVSQSPTLPSFISGIAPWHNSNEASNYMVFLTGGYLLRNRNPQGDWNGTHIHTTNPSSPAKGMKRRENNGKKNRRIRMVMPQLWHGQGMGWRHGDSMCQACLSRRFWESSWWYDHHLPIWCIIQLLTSNVAKKTHNCRALLLPGVCWLVAWTVVSYFFLLSFVFFLLFFFPFLSLLVFILFLLFVVLHWFRCCCNHSLQKDGDQQENKCLKD